MSKDKTIFIGVDPGKGGGITFLKKKKSRTYPMPGSPHELAELFRQHHTRGYSYFAMIEKVWSQPGNGHRQAFLFGQSLGVIEGVLAALEIQYDYVTPQKWQKEFGLILPKKKKKGKESVSKKKGRHKAAALRLYPHLKVTLKTCDSILIAHYCMMVRSRL